MQNTQSYASLLHISEPSFLNTCVTRSPVKRKISTADNKCGWSIVHLKKKSNKSVFLLEEPGNTKKEWQADGHQMGFLIGETSETIQHKTLDDDNVCTAPIMADKEILEFVQSSKNIINADFDDENEMNNAPVPISSEMRNIMKSMLSYLDALSNGEMNNKMDDIEQFLLTI
ncbi:hypothetical protein TNCV_1093411 [Trichonephila clavipes]|nr:hypothetical protein TNCV_1093411 [Trichonephila clavipes]